MHENIVRLKSVANILNGLGQQYAFVGGATVSLYATNTAAAAIRPTDDVDVVVELASYADQMELDQRLRSLGFENDVESGVICRYKVQGMIVDIMPTIPDIFGFSNRWYEDGFRAAVVHRFNDGQEVLIFSVPYFLASKWEAHKSRGGNDLRASKDFEDMVYVFENCFDFDEQLMAGPAEIKTYFKNEWEELLDRPSFEEAIYCHMEDSGAMRIIEKIKNSIK